jgi:hypothetical protein
MPLPDDLPLFTPYALGGLQLTRGRQRLPSLSDSLLATADDHVQNVAWGQLGRLAIEIFECVRGDSIPQRFIDTKGEGVWHYGYDVDDMNYTVDWMAEKGYGFVGEAQYVDGTRMCYFSTDGVGGAFFQAHEISQGSKLKHNLSSDR